MALFDDQTRTVDYVLVYRKSTLNDNSLTKLEKYLENVSNLGFDLEVAKFSADQDIRFVKVHVPDEAVFDYSSVFDTDLACRDISYRPFLGHPLHFMSTPLTKPESSVPEYDEVYPRAREAVSGDIPKNITSAERILIIYQLLSRTKFGEVPHQFGIDRLTKEKILIDDFPLHDGIYKWTETGPLNHRQLLAKYWGTIKCWYKAQPINLIETYFGTEYALYFAWLGFYVQMLIPIAVLSVVVFLYGIITMKSSLNIESPYVCNSKKIMCPKCHYKRCKPELLRKSCINSYLTYMFDNPTTIIFAVIVSLWSTVFMEMFQRYQSVLQLQWNASELEQDFILRPEYLESTPRRYSPITNQMEPYVPKAQQFSIYIITSVSILVLLLIMILGVIGVMIYRVTVKLALIRGAKDEVIAKNTDIIASISGAIMSALFIFLFKWTYEQLAHVLTNLEQHRTQYEYNNAYIFKSYALAFTNNYAAALYIAFFKGRFYTHPGDMSLWSNVGGLGSDRCDPTGCILDLSILLITIFVFKAIASNMTQVFTPLLIGIVKRKTKHVHDENIPQWEQDYLLATTKKFFIIDEYMDMVIQYGFVIFFVVAFPLTPLLAVISNFCELRVDASKVTKRYRRPIPNRVVGLGAWFGILQAMTYIGVATNGLIIAFTSDFVSKEVYKHTVDMSLKGFHNTTISVFDMADFEVKTSRKLPGNVCYYPGRRYPPGHPKKYQLTREYYYDLAIKFAAVLIYEHVLAACKGFLAYAIPDVPFSVKQELNKKAMEEKNLRMRHLNEEYDKIRGDSQKLDKSLDI